MCVGIHLGYGLAAIWYGILAMEIFKLVIYVYWLYYIDWHAMSMQAILAMEKAPEDTLKEVEESAKQYITAIVRSPFQK
jgi:hypothetical protein